MTIEKRALFLIICFFILASLLPRIEAALGVSPGKVDINYQPGVEKKIIFKILSDSNRKLEIFSEGEYTEYLKFDKTELSGAGQFEATFRMPENIEKPGKHQIIVGVRQKVDEELSPTGGATIGTSITIKAPIYIHVPFPGKYAEASLSSGDVNSGEPITFTLQIDNLGKEDISTQPQIEIYSLQSSGNNLTEILLFKPRQIKSQETIRLKKILNTSNYSPGLYKGIAIVDYGPETAKAESQFKLGNLLVKVISYTDTIIIGGMRNFKIWIESNWNNIAENVYADVSFLNNSQKEEVLTTFRTSPTTLLPWGKADLSGFFDSSNFSAGSYRANMSLVYMDHVSEKSGSVKFVKQYDLLMIGIIISLALLIVLVIVLSVKIYNLTHGKSKTRKNTRKK